MHQYVIAKFKELKKQLEVTQNTKTNTQERHGILRFISAAVKSSFVFIRDNCRGKLTNYL